MSPAISRNAHTAKSIICDVALDLLNLKVGETLTINLKGEQRVWRRIE